MAPKFNKRQWLTLLAIGSVHFSSAICISLQAPFYPHEAEKKGATATQYGLVFGSFEFIAFISSPFLGKHLDFVGAKLMLNIGMVIASISAVLFGMLDYVLDGTLFITLSFVLRMTESLGSTAALVAAFSITAAVFPDSVATTFATLEVFYGVGYIVGPTIGGLLYTIGGYKLPFVVNGTIMLLVAFAVYFCLPHVDSNVDIHKKQASIFNILRVPGVLLNSLSVVATSISMGYYSATLEPHLRQFNLSPIAMGLMFVISGGTYAAIAPIVGRLCDRSIYPKKVIAVGCLLVTISYMVVGPAPYIPLPTTLPMCIIGLVIHGFGLASLMVPTFIDSICSAVDAGFDDDISTYGLLSGLWASSFALGAFIGPSVAGFLYDLVGFRNGTLFVIVIHIVLFVAVVVFISCEKKPTIPPKRVRLLSERIEESSGTSSDHDISNDPETKPFVKMPQQWNQKNGTRVNGYGSVAKSIDYIS